MTLGITGGSGRHLHTSWDGLGLCSEVHPIMTHIWGGMSPALQVFGKGLVGSSLLWDALHSMWVHANLIL